MSDAFCVSPYKMAATTRPQRSQQTRASLKAMSLSLQRPTKGTARRKTWTNLESTRSLRGDHWLRHASSDASPAHVF